MNYPVENLVIDGESEDGAMAGDGQNPPFALFSPDLQRNVGGPYAKRKHAEKALKAIKQGLMVPYDSDAACSWTIDGKLSPWYDKD
jgi:hypothetical protein